MYEGARCEPVLGREYFRNHDKRRLDKVVIVGVIRLLLVVHSIGTDSGCCPGETRGRGRGRLGGSGGERRGGW